MLSDVVQELTYDINARVSDYEEVLAAQQWSLDCFSSAPKARDW